MDEEVDLGLVGFGPKVKDRSSRSVYIAPKVARPARLERATSRFGTLRSIQLSYGRLGPSDLLR